LSAKARWCTSRTSPTASRSWRGCPGRRRAVYVRTDVGDEESVRTLVAAVLAQRGRIDVLVNNAAQFATLAPVPYDRIDLALWDRVMRVNLAGTFLMCKHVGPHMAARGAGWPDAHLIEALALLSPSAYTDIVSLPPRPGQGEATAEDCCNRRPNTALIDHPDPDAPDPDNHRTTGRFPQQQGQPTLRRTMPAHSPPAQQAKDGLYNPAMENAPATIEAVPPRSGKRYAHMHLLRRRPLPLRGQRARIRPGHDTGHTQRPPTRTDAELAPAKTAHAAAIQP
jgi:NAD(P)-dependent dehydrogenase (short-subunit alcohol dehydrogenase family)